MRIASLSIDRPIPFIVLFAVLTFVGLVGFSKLTVQDMPDVDFPSVTVSAGLRGASASQMETEVARRIENAVSGIDGVEHIATTTSEGASRTTVEFALEKDLMEAVSETRDAVSRIRQELPAGMTEPTVSKVSTSGRPILTYAAEFSEGGRLTETDEERLSWFVDDEAAKKLLSVPGVGGVTRIGGLDREVRIEARAEALAARGVSAAGLARQVGANLDDSPSGTALREGEDLAVRTTGRFSSARDLEDLTLALPGGGRATLSSVASVRDGFGRRTEAALLNGRTAVAFQVYRSPGHGEPAVAEGVRKALDELAISRPDVRVREVSSTVPRVQAGYDSAMRALMEGALLAVVVVFAFLRDWRATAIAAVALPLSIIPTFGVMWLAGFSLNGITFLALTLVVGILVDDAIVEVENVARHMQGSPNPVEAAKKAVEEIGLAVVATSLTLMAVFVPTGVMSGVVGRFFKQFGLTAAVAVLFSLLVARLLTPMMAAALMRPARPKEDGAALRTYMRIVSACVSMPWRVMAGTAGVVVLSLVLLTTMESTFVPRSEQGQITASVEAPPGTSVESMREKLSVLSARMGEEPGVRSVFAAAYAGGRGSMIMERAEGEGRQTETESRLAEIAGEVPGIRVSFGGGGSGEKAVIRLASDDPEILKETAERVEKEIRGLPWAIGVSSSARAVANEIKVIPDRDRMAELGVSTTELAQSARIALSGDYDQALPKMSLPERLVPVRVSLTEERGTAWLGSIPVATKNGTAPLSSIARIEEDAGPAAIERYDRRRTATIEADLGDVSLGRALKDIEALPAMREMPDSVLKISSGDAQRMKELFGNFGMAMAAGILCIYVLLVLLFHDFAQPLTILSALPLSAGGAFGMLALFGHGMSMPALIGLLMLMGIVTKNSILLVEYAVMSTEKGMSRREAILDACHKRAQPIVMTTVAMIAGMLPMALSGDAQSAFRVPMALAVIGGLMTSTVLSLGVVPVVYLLIGSAKDRMTEKFSRKEKG